MDPNANLKAQRKIIARLKPGDDYNHADVYRLIKLVEALDWWMTQGHAMPEAWSRGLGRIKDIPRKDDRF